MSVMPRRPNSLSLSCVCGEVLALGVNQEREEDLRGSGGTRSDCRRETSSAHHWSRSSVPANSQPASASLSQKFCLLWCHSWERLCRIMDRMSHEEERVKGVRMRNKRERAPPHWLNPLVGSHRDQEPVNCRKLFVA